MNLIHQVLFIDTLAKCINLQDIMRLWNFTLLKEIWFQSHLKCEAEDNLFLNLEAETVA